MKEIVFLGGKEIGFYCLEHLLEKAAFLGVRVKAALTNERKIHPCRKNNIPVLGSLDEFLRMEDCDILISVQYHEILKPEHFGKARQIAVNLHMAPLPEYRGCNQFSYAIIDNAKEFGTTIHRMEEKIDGGDILFEKRFAIPGDCDVTSLYRKTFEESVTLFKESLEKIIDGNYVLTPQNCYSGKRSSAFHLREDIEKLKQIDLGWEKEKILRHFRATYFPPFPPPYALVNGERIEITPEWIKKNIPGQKHAIK
jgi:methionyl-tRNA formyltransferase